MTEQIAGLEAADIAKMSMTQANSFASDTIQAMSSEQLNALIPAQVSPMILDLDGDGVETRSAADGVNFDLLGLGVWQKWGWSGSDDGLLVRDLNGDGQINDGRELFGNGTRMADGSLAKDGYAAMSALDSNGDGKLDAKDTDFAQLQVWVDADSDGVTDSGELKSLDSLRIASLDLQAQTSSAVNNGNLVGLVSGYQTTDGKTHDMADVWFSRDTSQAATTVAPTGLQANEEPRLQLSDVLVPPNELPLPGDSSVDKAATQVQIDMPLLKPRKPGEEDDLNQPIPLI
jgi:hypothetical protein